MITEFTTRVQTPDEGFDWLYKDQEGEPRMFRHEVGLPPEAEPWGQCTDAEKVAWEEEWEQEHPEQEPTPEPSQDPEPDPEPSPEPSESNEPAQEEGGEV